MTTRATRRLALGALTLATLQTACPGFFWRHERREERREYRQDHRDERREHRQENREERRERWD